MAASPDLLLAAALVFIAAGFVKGVIGLGLPMISLALLTTFLGVPTAMALVLAPSFVANLWQACAGGRMVAIVKRTWPFMLTATLGIGLGVKLLAVSDPRLPRALLGVLLIVYAGWSLARPQLRLTGPVERRLAPVVGIVNGVVTGMTGAFAVPGTLYLQAIGLPRDTLIQAMGILFLLSTLGLGLALGWESRLPGELALVSAAAIVPALIGVALGQRVRRRLSEVLFRKFLFSGLMLLGLFLVLRALA